MTPLLTAEGTSRTVQTGKWKNHYNEAGTGRPVLMLHGSGPGAMGWNTFGPNMRRLPNASG
ncbi:alpha/beta fold hydrolase [Streptomyces sp. R08]|uniref:Alpha/beta fold hydrolase n=1 Tax=Streptomyces sp. R08 TaxID=3238624 RepID=A0AB39MMS3_9ACTN